MGKRNSSSDYSVKINSPKFLANSMRDSPGPLMARARSKVQDSVRNRFESANSEIPILKNTASSQCKHSASICLALLFVLDGRVLSLHCTNGFLASSETFRDRPEIDSFHCVCCTVDVKIQLEVHDVVMLFKLITDAMREIGLIYHCSRKCTVNLEKHTNR